MLFTLDGTEIGFLQQRGFSVFTHHYKGKDSDNKGTKEKMKSLGKLRHGETSSFIPHFREPSSIQDFERDPQLLASRYSTLSVRPKMAPYDPPRAFLNLEDQRLI